MKNATHRMKLAWLVAFTLCLFFAPSVSVASTGGTPMPWDSAFSALVENVSGPVAHGVVIAAIAIAGAVWALTEHGTGIKRLSMAVFGGAVAVGALDLATTLGIAGAIA